MFGGLLKKIAGKLDPMGMLNLALNQVPNGKGKDLASKAFGIIQGGANPSSFMDAIENSESMLNGIIPNGDARIDYLKNHPFWKHLRSLGNNTSAIETWGQGFAEHMGVMKK
jgi:hypothetical protein